MSDTTNISRDELQVLIEEGLVDWISQAKQDLESQGVDFSDGVDGEEVGKILSYGGERLRGAFDDILSRFGGDETGSQESEQDQNDTQPSRRATSSEMDRVKENYKYSVLKGTRDYSSLDMHERELYDIFFGKRGGRLNEATGQPWETLEDIFMLGWNIVDEVFEGSIDFIQDFSESIFEDCVDWEEHDAEIGIISIDYGEGGLNPLNWIPDVGLIEIGPRDVDFGCIARSFFQDLWRNLRQSVQDISLKTIRTSLDIFGINEPYPEWISRALVKMWEIGLISFPGVRTVSPNLLQRASEDLEEAGSWWPGSQLLTSQGRDSFLNAANPETAEQFWIGIGGLDSLESSLGEEWADAYMQELGIDPNGPIQKGRSVEKASRSVRSTASSLIDKGIDLLGLDESKNRDDILFIEFEKIINKDILSDQSGK